MSPFITTRPSRLTSAARIAILGFTLVELMATIAVLAILAAVAAPRFSDLIQRWRVAKSVDGLRQTLHHARSEAIKHNGNVVLQKLPSGAGACSTAADNKDWSCGWLLCHDIDGSGKCDAGETVIHRYTTPAGVQVRRTAGGASIRFNRWGLVSGTYLGFGLAPLGEASTHRAARGVCVSSAGRVRVAPPATRPCGA